MTFKIAIISDTQLLVENYPDTWDSLCTWLVANYVAEGIEIVLTLGDMVSDATVAQEWTDLGTGVAILKASDLPFLITSGNHDGSRSTDVPSEAAFRTAIPTSTYTDKAWWSGGFYDTKPDNAYCILTIDGTDYLFMTLQWALTDAALSWAGGIIAANPTKEVIIVTHSFLNSDGLEQSDDTYSPGGIGNTLTDFNCGQEIWDSLKAYSNIRWIINGHLPPLYYEQLIGTNGNIVNAMMVDTGIGNGSAKAHMGILTIDPTNNRCDYEAYDPLTDISLGSSLANTTYTPFRSRYVATENDWNDWDGYILINKPVEVSAGDWTTIKGRLSEVLGMSNLDSQPYKRYHTRVLSSTSSLIVAHFDREALNLDLHRFASYISGILGITLTNAVSYFTDEITIWDVTKDWFTSGTSAKEYLITLEL